MPPFEPHPPAEQGFEDPPETDVALHNWVAFVLAETKGLPTDDAAQHLLSRVLQGDPQWSATRVCLEVITQLRFALNDKETLIDQVLLAIEKVQLLQNFARGDGEVATWVKAFKARPRFDHVKDRNACLKAIEGKGGERWFKAVGWTEAKCSLTGVRSLRMLVLSASKGGLSPAAVAKLVEEEKCSRLKGRESIKPHEEVITNGDLREASKRIPVPFLSIDVTSHASSTPELITDQPDDTLRAQNEQTLAKQISASHSLTLNNPVLQLPTDQSPSLARLTTHNRTTANQAHRNMGVSAQAAASVSLRSDGDEDGDGADEEDGEGHGDSNRNCNVPGFGVWDRARDDDIPPVVSSSESTTAAALAAPCRIILRLAAHTAVTLAHQAAANVPRRVIEAGEAVSTDTGGSNGEEDSGTGSEQDVIPKPPRVTRRGVKKKGAKRKNAASMQNLEEPVAKRNTQHQIGSRKNAAALPAQKMHRTVPVIRPPLDFTPTTIPHRDELVPSEFYRNNKRVLGYLPGDNKFEDDKQGYITYSRVVAYHRLVNDALLTEARELILPVFDGSSAVETSLNAALVADHIPSGRVAFFADRTERG